MLRASGGQWAPWLASLGLVLLLIAGAWLRQRQRVRTPSLQGKDLKDKP